MTELTVVRVLNDLTVAAFTSNTLQFFIAVHLHGHKM